MSQIEDVGPASLAYERLHLHDREVLVLHGDIDLSNVDVLRTALADLTGPLRVIDFCYVTFIETIAIHALIDHERSLPEGVDMQLVFNRDSIVARVFSIIRVDEMFDCAECHSEYH